MLNRILAKNLSNVDSAHRSDPPLFKKLCNEQSLQHLEGTAVVTETIVPGMVGRIQHCGSWWSAQCDQDITLFPGDQVYVFGIHDITLWVEPAMHTRNAIVR